LQDLHKLRQATAYYEWLQQFVQRLEAGEFFNLPFRNEETDVDGTAANNIGRAETEE
jgi:hypothetical protein